MDRQIIDIRANRKNVSVALDEIVYIESMRHNITVYTKEEKWVSRMKLNDLCDELPDNFIRIHQSYAVNAKYIESLKADKICLQGGQGLPVSHRRRRTVREEYRLFKVRSDWKRW